MSKIFSVKLRTGSCIVQAAAIPSIYVLFNEQLVTNLIQSFYSLSVPLTVRSVGFLSLCPLPFSTLCPMSVSTLRCKACWFCHYVHCCLLQIVHCLSLPHSRPSVCFLSLCPLLSSTVCPMSVSTSHFTICWFCDTMSINVFYCMPTVCQ
jgi:hypothetical protein